MCRLKLQDFRFGNKSKRLHQAPIRLHHPHRKSRRSLTTMLFDSIYLQLKLYRHFHGRLRLRGKQSQRPLNYFLRLLQI